jgi:hypothetical protein
VAIDAEPYRIGRRMGRGARLLASSNRKPWSLVDDDVISSD